MRNHLLDAWMADADAHPAVVLAHVAVDRANTVVASGAAANLDPHFARSQIEFIVEYGEVGRRELVEAHRLADRLPQQIYECLRFDEDDLFVANAALGDQRLEFPRPGRKGMATGNLFAAR